MTNGKSIGCQNVKSGPTLPSLPYCRDSNEQKYSVGFSPSSIHHARVLIFMPSILICMISSNSDFNFVNSL